MKSDHNWYKDAIIYELHIKTFFDSNDDGIGDFKGLIQKLDYIRELGVTAIWILPFYPSPLRDDGYDIADYLGINPDYGTIKDFQRFLNEAHKRDLKVITELVLNHTSDRHSWFQRARKSPEKSLYRNYYVWSKTIKKYEGVRIIFGDYEQSNWTWDDEAQAYYWHRFYAHQPDLNYDNPHVQKEVFKIIDFWMDMGVDGFRLDAVPYLYQREGTNCENLPQTHMFLKKLRKHVDSRSKEKTIMLLAEANQWPEDAIEYFGNDDECHMCFHFPVMPRLFMAIQMEDTFPILDILEQTPNIPPDSQWGLFLRNHDELTLEMVSDEERDFMHRMYAKDPRTIVNLGIRRRLAPLLGNDRRRIELMYIMLFSFPGTPFIYYGDEIGMGDNVYLGDRHGVRTPMQWSNAPNAGFSRSNPQQLYLPLVIDPAYHHNYINVENQEYNPSSLLWWIRQVLSIRKNHIAFGRGEIEIIHTGNKKVLAFLRKYEDEIILAVINLSRFSQDASLELQKYEGYTPVELFSHNRFLLISQTPYRITMNRHGYYWMLLEQPKEIISEPCKIIEIDVPVKWHNVFEGSCAQELASKALRNYLKKAHWFNIQSKTVRNITLVDTIAASRAKNAPVLLIYRALFQNFQEETYLVAADFAYTVDIPQEVLQAPDSLICMLRVDGKEGYLYDAVYSQSFRTELIALFLRKKRIPGKTGSIEITFNETVKRSAISGNIPDNSKILTEKMKNVHIDFGKRFFGKIYRKMEEGIPPEREIMKYLGNTMGYAHIPKFLGVIDYKDKENINYQLALLEEWIGEANDTSVFIKNATASFIDEIVSQKPKSPNKKGDGSYDIKTNLQDIPKEILAYTGEFVYEMIELLGKRIAQMHLCLASVENGDAFKPQELSEINLRSHYQSFRNVFRRVCIDLKDQDTILKTCHKEDVRNFLESEEEVLRWFQGIYERNINGLKIRNHDNLNLENILFNGKDFIIIDWGGNKDKQVSERRLKRTVFSDIAAVVYSMDTAISDAIRLYPDVVDEEDSFILEWREIFSYTLISVFIKSYMDAVAVNPSITPEKDEDFIKLLDMALLKKSSVNLQNALKENHEGEIKHALYFAIKLISSVKKGK